jgi:hypothetical protein
VDLLILPVIWAVVLIPPWIRRRREGRPAESILSFHRKLWELERTSIYSDAAPADAYDPRRFHDLRHDADHSYSALDGAHMYGEAPLSADGVVAGSGLASAGLGSGSGSGSASAEAAGAADPALVPSPAQRLASRQALYRRRRIFFGLLASLVLTLVAAGVVGGTVAWSIHVVVSVLFVTYIALLVRHHQRVVEQVAKVRYLQPIRAPRPAVVVVRSGSDG